ncbi:hypothetical protein [Kutzneria albida]|uniref:Uncharacterized protein n=1 Tax=Kutzneria albida DSM 43870 TaxID=1449976 RepID=W5WCA8_9PSEU|nr:hypothetical protein [Kutzneria albida]AHH98537.1 hypothetical protein KALB_5175 [Kutzneria albida DSM 43870]
MDERVYTVTGAELFAAASRWLYGQGDDWYRALAFASYLCERDTTLDSDFSRWKREFDYDPRARPHTDFYGSRPDLFCTVPSTCGCWRHHRPDRSAPH